MKRRWLFLATVGMYRDIRDDGATMFMMDIVRELTEAGHYCYVVFPSDCNIADLPPIPRCMYFGSDLPVAVYDTQHYTVDSAYLVKMFGVYGQYIVDAAVVFSSALVLPVKQALGAINKAVAIPVVFIENGVDWITTLPSYKIGTTTEQWRCLGVAYADCTVVLSEFDRKNWEAKLRAHDLSHRQLDQALDGLRVGSAPVDLQLIAKFERDPYPTPTALYAARFNAAKNPEKILGVFDELYKEGLDMQVQCLTPTSELKGSVVAGRYDLLTERQYLQVKWGANWETFYNEARRSHVFVCWSHSESYNASLVEAALLGCVVLVVDTQNMRDLYPQGLGGPEFWLKNEDDAVEKVRWVLKNYEAAWAKQEELRQSFRDQQKNTIALAMTKRIDEVMSVPRSFSDYSMTLNSGLGLLIAEIAKTSDGFAFQEMLDKLGEIATSWLSSNVRRYTSRKLPTNFVIHRMLVDRLGLTDTCESRMPTYKRITDDQG